MGHHFEDANDYVLCRSKTTRRKSGVAPFTLRGLSPQITTYYVENIFGLTYELH